MTVEELLRRVRLRNAFHLGMGIVLVPTSLALWVASFYVFWGLFAIPLCAFGYKGWTIGYYGAWAAMIPLAIEGWRYKEKLFDPLVFAKSGYYQNALTDTRTGRAMDFYFGGPMGMAFLVSQFLFCAPRSAVHAVREFRSTLRTDPATAAEAARIAQELKQSANWLPASAYKDSGAALALLRRLDLLRFRDGAEEVEIRWRKEAG
jgi:hypothetical protein